MVATFQISAAGMSGRIRAAGHPPALIMRADGGIEDVGQVAHCSA
jgi:hypothetical protein